MSKVKKSKKARRPNIPMGTGPVTGAVASPNVAAGGGLEARGEIRAARSAPAPVTFDYTHIKKDLTRIGVLAGSFVAILVALSFILK